MTDGFEVFVHDVMAAMTTAPWSSSNSVPSASFTRAGFDGRPSSVGRALGTAGASAAVSRDAAGGSLAGKLSFDDSSTLPLAFSSSSTYVPRAERNASLADLSGTRSCGRFGPASDGSTVDKSSSSRSL